MISIQQTIKVLTWITPSSGSSTENKDEYRKQVGWAVDAIARRILNDRTCLTQALTARQLLLAQNIPAAFCIGVAKKEDENLLAHAWIESDDIIVIGGPREKLSGLTPLPTFDWMSS